MLTAAVAELSWLLDRGYADNAALKLVGDRHGLRERQRAAVRRCAAGDAAVVDRRARRIEPGQLTGRPLAIDGFNCVITIEAAIAGGVVLRGRDRVYRDLASVHGSYRRVEETTAAVTMVAAVLAEWSPGQVTWYLDRPVGNSGRLRQLLLDHANGCGQEWRVELVDDPDRILIAVGDVVASGDSGVLDRCGPWIDLTGAVIAGQVGEAWIVDLG